MPTSFTTCWKGRGSLQRKRFDPQLRRRSSSRRRKKQVPHPFERRTGFGMTSFGIFQRANRELGNDGQHEGRGVLLVVIDDVGGWLHFARGGLGFARV